MYAIVATGGKQYRVKEGMEIDVEKLRAEPGDEIALDNVLLLGQDDDVKIGTPYLENAKVTCEVVKHDRGDKVIIFKHKRRKDYRRKTGHRQDYTRLKVTAIQS
ncbi:50S ribosomal protein L21 [Desulfohalobium retbaense]|uniref:Large ribosomal subunit protein bL21 n=1 Tax=Desulfohalobium retbaense (strain ATCC 49708 / DSM 5692 / JCM 16813 / HR100) TaxID=485915 RepID=C8X4W9_DESRD|nr:50S ribosomal protein L21 [Desulfohalobium retbaense]ACV69466.1 ribosomal protein L21 [Desulfohalobium retbaense DSM 5692]